AARAGHAYLDLATSRVWRETLEPRITAIRQDADVVLVAVHWGRNNELTPSRDEINAGHAIIDAGADAVLGSSAHLLQGIEVYNNRPIIHDAGDLFFDAFRREDTNSGIFTLEIDHTGVRRVTFTPLEIGFCQTKMLDGKAAKAAT